MANYLPPAGYSKLVSPYGKGYGQDLLPGILGPNLIFLPGGEAAVLKQIANRSAIPNSQVASSGGINGRTYQYNRSGKTITTGLQVEWINAIFLSGNWNSNGGVRTIQGAALEYPIGSPHQRLTFGGANTLAIPDLASGISDPLNPLVAIPPNALFGIHSYETNAVNIPYTVGPFKSVTALGDATRQSGTDFSQTQGVAYSDDGSTFNLVPAGIYAKVTSSPEVLMFGDSRNGGAGEGNAGQDITGDCGTGPRALGALHPYRRGSSSGMTVQSLAGAQVNLFAFLSRVRPDYALIDGMGINDLRAGRTAPQIIADLTTVVAKIKAQWQNLPVYIATIYPNTTSTDGWTTLVNQTATVTAATVNAAIIAGIPGASGFKDSAASIGDTVTPSKFRIDLGALTSDGLHCIALGDKQPVYSIP